MDAEALQGLSRSQLQSLARQHGVRANGKSIDIIAQLLEKYPDGVPRREKRETRIPKKHRTRSQPKPKAEEVATEDVVLESASAAPLRRSTRAAAQKTRRTRKKVESHEPPQLEAKAEIAKADVKTPVSPVLPVAGPSRQPIDVVIDAFSTPDSAVASSSRQPIEMDEALRQAQAFRVEVAEDTHLSDPESSAGLPIAEDAAPEQHAPDAADVEPEEPAMSRKDLSPGPALATAANQPRSRRVVPFRFSSVESDGPRTLDIEEDSQHTSPSEDYLKSPEINVRPSSLMAGVLDEPITAEDVESSDARLSTPVSPEETHLPKKLPLFFPGTPSDEGDPGPSTRAHRTLLVSPPQPQPKPEPTTPTLPLDEAAQFIQDTLAHAPAYAHAPHLGVTRKDARAILREITDLANECTAICAQIDDAYELRVLAHRDTLETNARIAEMQRWRKIVEVEFMKNLKKEEYFLNGGLTPKNSNDSPPKHLDVNDVDIVPYLDVEDEAGPWNEDVLQDNEWALDDETGARGSREDQTTCLKLPQFVDSAGAGVLGESDDDDDGVVELTDDDEDSEIRSASDDGDAEDVDEKDVEDEEDLNKNIQISKRPMQFSSSSAAEVIPQGGRIPGPSATQATRDASPGPRLSKRKRDEIDDDDDDQLTPPASPDGPRAVRSPKRSRHRS